MVKYYIYSQFLLNFRNGVFIGILFSVVLLGFLVGHENAFAQVSGSPGLPSNIIIGNFVWNDLDGDGIQDADEPGVPGVKVDLITSLMRTTVASTITDANGFYQFNVPHDIYIVRLTVPSGMVSTLVNQGFYDFRDSDFEPSNSMGSVSTRPFSGGPIDTIDAGLILLNQIPTANAGVPQTVNERELVTLDGTASSDPDGIIASYSWTQTAGAAVTLDTTITSNPTFVAPTVGPAGDTLTFSLTVTDDLGSTSTNVATVSITVNNVILDTDGDGIPDSVDNCPNTANPLRTDTDGDGIGDVCDATPNGEADLSVGKSGPSQVTSGDSILDTIVVRNLGPDTARNVVVTDPIPIEIVQLDLVSVSPITVCSVDQPTRLITCNLGDIATTDLPVRIDVTLPTENTFEGIIANSASVTFDSADANSANDQGTATTTVSLPDANDTPRDVKAAVLGKLAQLQTLSSDKKTDKSLEKAVESVQDSLDDKLWIDGSHLDPKKGNKVFDGEKKAAHELQKILEKDDSIDATLVQRAIDDLCAVDKSLAQTAIDDVNDPDNKKIKDANKKIDKAQTELDKNRCDKAIDNYKDAWKKAQDALKGDDNDDEDKKDKHDDEDKE